MIRVPERKNIEREKGIFKKTKFPRLIKDKDFGLNLFNMDEEIFRYNIMRVKNIKYKEKILKVYRGK